MAFGAEVKRLRKERQFTQDELAARSQLSTRYLSRVELGNVNLGLLAVFRIAQGLGLHPSELLEGVSEDAPEKGTA